MCGESLNVGVVSAVCRLRGWGQAAVAAEAKATGPLEYMPDHLTKLENLESFDY